MARIPPSSGGRAGQVSLVGQPAAELVGQQIEVNAAQRKVDQDAVSGNVSRGEAAAAVDAAVMALNTQLANAASTPTDRSKAVADFDPGAAQLIASQAAMAGRPQDPDRLEVLAPPDPGELRETIESDITGLLYGLAGLALVVGMIGIANTTLVAVLERRSEIGVRRALGARRRHVALQCLTESATLGTLGGILGTSLGILAVVLVSAQRDWTTLRTLDPWLTLPAPIIGAATGLIAGLQPSWRAARITPATALRTE